MLKELAEFLQDGASPKTFKIGPTLKLIDKDGKTLDAHTSFKTTRLHTLDGFLEFISSVDAEQWPISDAIAIIGEDGCSIDFQTNDGEYTFAECSGPKISGFHGLSQEQAIVYLKTNFEETEERDELLNLISSIIIDENVVLNDDGVSQEVRARKGVSLSEKKETKSTYKLQAFPPFPELETSRREFLFRISQKGNSVSISLLPTNERFYERLIRDAICQYLKENHQDLRVAV